MDNSLDDEEPKSSPRFGENGTITVSTSYAVRSQLNNLNTLGIGLIVMMAFAKII